MPAERGNRNALPVILFWSALFGTMLAGGGLLEAVLVGARVVGARLVGAGLFGAGLFGTGLVGTGPLLVHPISMVSVSPWLIGAVAVVQITAITGFVTRKRSMRSRAILVMGLLAAAAVVAVLSGLPGAILGVAAAGCCHAIAYSSLLIWFATSLRANREPVVTGFARRLRQTMPEKVVRYTRRVTVAWCVFFATQLIVSAALLLAAPLTIWFVFVNLLNLPLVGIMVLAEFGYRLILFRHEPHTSLIDTLSALRHARIIPANRP